MNYILFDHSERISLLPLTYMRPVADIRIGILKIYEKWELLLSHKISYLTADYLAEKFPLHTEDENILINGAVLPDEFLIDAISSLKPNQALIAGNTIIAMSASKNEIENNEFLKTEKNEIRINEDSVGLIKYSWDVFRLNEREILADFNLLTRGRKSQHIYAPNQLMGIENIFIEEGASVSASVLNAKTGPIYIGKNAEVMEGCLIRGPFCLGDNSTLKMGAKIYGATTIGNDCKVGGEVTNSVMLGYSNKAHDGYIGNTVIGEWCNLGADTNTSNLKNNYGNVKVWSFGEGKYIDTGLVFCGLTMGDHSKCSINTQFNTGTVVGVSANIFGEGFPSKNIASFSWGGSKGFEKFELNKAIALAEKVYQRRNLVFSEADKAIFRYLYNS